MERNEIQKLIQNEINSYMNTKQYNVSKIPNHLHNGTDTNKINGADIVNNAKMYSFLVQTKSETFTITNLIPNINRISFYGFSANNADGSAATKRCLLNGEAYLGNCIEFSGESSVMTGNKISAATTPRRKSIIQSSNALYTDTANFNKTKVAASGLNLLYCVDDTGAVVTQLTILSWNGTSVTFEAYVASNFKIQGNLLFT